MENVINNDGNGSIVGSLERAELQKKLKKVIKPLTDSKVYLNEKISEIYTAMDSVNVARQNLELLLDEVNDAAMKDDIAAIEINVAKVEKIKKLMSENDMFVAIEKLNASLAKQSKDNFKGEEFLGMKFSD